MQNQDQNEKFLKFPNGFLWGAATSSHQVEGGNRNDWSEWEDSELRIKNYELRMKKKFDHDNFVSGAACDSYNHWSDDLECIKKLNLNAYRFSIEWSRIEPEEGKFSEKGMDYYRKIIKDLKANNIIPFITLWHFTTPIWMAKKGGWTSSEINKFFLRYVEKIVTEFKNDVDFWVTFNEPDIYAGFSFLKGEWPPEKKNIFLYCKSLFNLIKVHNDSYLLIKKIDSRAQVGIAKHNIYFEAYENRVINLVLKKFMDWWWNSFIFNRIKKYQDFLGLNHYNHNRINYGFYKNENKIMSDMGWEFYPSSIYFALIDLKKYNKPIYITENGWAESGDVHRLNFIQETLENVHKTIEDGVDVRGYFYWSLLDNFEWARGFEPKFGLCEVNRKTFERKARPSAKVYAEICKNNGFVIE